MKQPHRLNTRVRHIAGPTGVVVNLDPGRRMTGVLLDSDKATGYISWVADESLEPALCCSAMESDGTCRDCGPGRAR